MSTTSVFYQIGQAVKSTVNTAVSNLLSGVNTWTGSSNTFNQSVNVGSATQYAGNTKGTLVVYGGGDVKDNLTVGGNLTVNGTTTSIQTTNTQIKDNLIVINDGANDSSSEASDSGLLFERATGTQNGAFVFEESLDRFEVGLTDGTGSAVSLGSVSLGALAVNSLLIGTRAATQELGDYTDFTTGLNA